MRHLTALKTIRGLATSPADSARSEIYRIASQAIFVGDEGRPQDINDEAVLNVLDQQEGETATALRSFIEAAFADRLAVERYESGGKPDLPRCAAAILARAESFVSGFEDDDTQEGVPALLADLRALIAGTAPQPVTGSEHHAELAGLRVAIRGLLPLAEARAEELEMLNEGDEDEAEPDDGRKAAADEAQRAITAARAALVDAQTLDPGRDLSAIVGEMIFGEGTDSGLQRVIDLCNDARKRHGITRETVAAGGIAPAPQTPVIPVEAFNWQDVGHIEDGGDAKARLLSSLQIGDCMFHVEAREIDPEADPQSTLEYADDFDKFGDIADQGDFATMTREGREYFVFILPYEA